MRAVTFCGAAKARPSQGCQQLSRHTQPFHSSAITLSGHNRWSTIRHDKAKNDALKNKARSAFAKEISNASKFFGPDPDANPRLADLIVKAKRNGFAKQGIEAAIARGQGKSTTGAALEPVTIEAILPGNVGVIIDCESDSRLRTIQQLKTVIKKHGGAASPSSYLFNKQGKIVLEEKEGIDADEVLDVAIEAGATDVEEEDGTVVVYAEPNEVKEVAEKISAALSVDISSSEIVWTPQEDLLVTLADEEAAGVLCKFVDDLHENDTSVQGVFMNVSQGSVGEEPWSALGAKLSA